MKLKDLTLNEKVELLVGSKQVFMNTASLGGKVYSITTSDGPIGPHFSKPLLWLPSITTLCSSWDIDLVKDYVDALSDVCVLIGHGLSYSSFVYDDLEVKNEEENIQVSFSIKNTRLVKAKEVAQVYVHREGGQVDRPYRELKGFEKVELNPQEEKRVTIVIPNKELCYFNENKNSWADDDSSVELLIGSSSKDIRLRKILN